MINGQVCVLILAGLFLKMSVFDLTNCTKQAPNPSDECFTDAA